MQNDISFQFLETLYLVNGGTECIYLPKFQPNGHSGLQSFSKYHQANKSGASLKYFLVQIHVLPAPESHDLNVDFR